MKILAGSLRGRVITQPPTRSVRPLSEKVRAAIFDVIGAPQGLSVLDAYAGSGAAGFEAASRGALLVEAIEQNPRVAAVIDKNSAALDLGLGYILYRMSVESWLASPAQQPPAPRYDVIVADPPYAKLDDEVIERLVAFLKPGGVLVLSHAAKITAPALSVPMVRQKTYGDTSLTFYQAEE